MACKSFVGKTWGMKPRIIHWIYTSIVRPMLTYAAFVWWPRVKLRSAVAELNKLQRLAMLAIAGCRKSTPSAALETLLDIPQLHVSIMKEAALTSYRLLDEIKPKPGDFTGHLEIFEKFEELEETREASDQIPLRFDFDITFDTIFPTREDWHMNHSTSEDETIQFFTDGSHINGCTGAGIFGPGIRAWLPMGTMATVFQAEVYAIERSERKIFDNII